ncbi:HNH endonuclease family protein, partial [Acinetobacter baumannii]|nr:HNH endonuclease family protein [Acinetobacter baumannii]
EDTNIFPSDEQVRKAIFNKALINKYTREVLYIISLYDLSDPKVDNHVLSLDGFSLEHLMPKKWQNNWDIPETKELIDQNNYKLLTLGNLALIKGTLNSKLRDAAWSSKRKDLDTYSTLKRTRECLDKEIWDVKQIDERSHSLFKAIMQIWPKESLV